MVLSTGGVPPTISLGVDPMGRGDSGEGAVGSSGGLVAFGDGDGVVGSYGDGVGFYCDGDGRGGRAGGGRGDWE